MLPRPVCQTPHTGRRREGAALTIGEQAAPAVARRIWGTLDTILLIFAGSAAEFALNKAVDWLFYTGVPPGAPVERFFERCASHRRWCLATRRPAAAVRAVNAAHAVEQQRHSQWAYRDTLFMLIDYGERAHRTFKPMTDAAACSLGVAADRRAAWHPGRAAELRGVS